MQGRAGSTYKGFDYVCELMVNEFGGINRDDIDFPLEEWDKTYPTLENLPPEVLAYAPEKWFREYFMLISTPEAREETQRIYDEYQYKQQERAEQYAREQAEPITPKKNKKQSRDASRPRKKHR